MEANQGTFELQLPPMGADCERELIDSEMKLLRNVLVGTGDQELDDHLLADFASFMAFEIVRDDITETNMGEYFADQGYAGASYALTLRAAALADEWPAGTTPAGYVFGFVESWLTQSRSTIDDMSVGEYLRLGTGL